MEYENKHPEEPTWVKMYMGSLDFEGCEPLEVYRETVFLEIERFQIPIDKYVVKSIEDVDEI